MNNQTKSIFLAALILLSSGCASTAPRFPEGYGFKTVRFENKKASDVELKLIRFCSSKEFSVESNSRTEVRCGQIMPKDGERLAFAFHYGDGYPIEPWNRMRFQLSQSGNNVNVSIAAWTDAQVAVRNAHVIWEDPEKISKLQNEIINLAKQ
jgi:hypothetical protein